MALALHMCQRHRWPGDWLSWPGQLGSLLLACPACLLLDWLAELEGLAKPACMDWLGCFGWHNWARWWIMCSFGSQHFPGKVVSFSFCGQQRAQALFTKLFLSSFRLLQPASVGDAYHIWRPRAQIPGPWGKNWAHGSNVGLMRPKGSRWGPYTLRHRMDFQHRVVLRRAIS